MKANVFSITGSKVYGGVLALTYVEAKVKTGKKNSLYQKGAVEFDGVLIPTIALFFLSDLLLPWRT